MITEYNQDALGYLSKIGYGYQFKVTNCQRKNYFGYFGIDIEPIQYSGWD